ncbi:uncharacterized protein [Rutidosis leptorrhynchoides]|uniref:uncharacterized protein n=1 Tax=Rutidosis leptorrhynchoides TaxID=125765 RepID=UPI003A9A1399
MKMAFNVWKTFMLIVNILRKWSEKRLNVRTNAHGEVIKSLPPMVDNFERAKHQLKLKHIIKKIDASYQGIHKKFVEIMRSLSCKVDEVFTSLCALLWSKKVGVFLNKMKI